MGKHVPSPNDKRLVGDDFLSKIGDKMNETNMMDESNGNNLQESESYLIEEIRELKQMVRLLRREMKSVVREELDNLKDETTLITEGDAETMHIVLGQHHFKGKVQHVPKKRK